MNFDPCSDLYVHAYLNRPDGQVELHADVTKLQYNWQPCRRMVVAVPQTFQFIADYTQFFYFIFFIFYTHLKYVILIVAGGHIDVISPFFC